MLRERDGQSAGGFFSANPQTYQAPLNGGRLMRKNVCEDTAKKLFVRVCVRIFCQSLQTGVLVECHILR